MAGLFALDRDTRIRQQSSPGAAKPPLAYLITGSFSYWWNGGGEDSVHSSVVAPSPHGLSATFFLRRSEEHTSELQSLMRNSYAVFCLTKKNLHNKNIIKK